MSLSLAYGPVLNVGPAWDSPLPLSLSLPCCRSLSKQTLIKINMNELYEKFV